MLSPIFSLTSTALLLGGLHALDSDHLMAVTALSHRQHGSRQLVAFCLRWASGHGLTLLVLGLLVGLAGIGLPKSFSLSAELAIALLLLTAGGGLLWRLGHDLAEHRRCHHRLPRHSHGWFGTGAEAAHRHPHLPVLVGIVHGAAGSSQLLALLPLAGIHDATTILAYLLCFTFGTLLTMMLVGALLGQMRRHLTPHPRLTLGMRAVTGLGCLLSAGWLLRGLSL